MCIGVLLLQGTYAVVEFANRESVASILEGASIPSASHESTVPFKSRLLSLRNIGTADSSKLQTNQHQPQTTIPINELIERLSKEKSVSGWRFQRRICVNPFKYLSEINYVYA